MTPPTPESVLADLRAQANHVRLCADTARDAAVIAVNAAMALDRAVFAAEAMFTTPPAKPEPDAE